MKHDGTFILNNPESGDIEKAIRWLKIIGNQVKGFTHEEIHGRLKPSDKKRRKVALAMGRRRRMEKKKSKELDWRWNGKKI